MSPVNDEDYGNFLDYRRQLDSVKSEQIRSFDKHILAVASGAFGISLFLVKDSSTAGRDCMGVLYSSWVALLVCIVLTIFSFLYSAHSSTRAIEELDEAYENNGDWRKSNPKVERRSGVVSCLNKLSFSFFVAGIACLAMFALSNI